MPNILPININDPSQFGAIGSQAYLREANGMNAAAIASAVGAACRETDLISAWNDSGGYLTRLLDGALDTRVWPYELLLGNDDIKDGFDGWFKSCYRWPGFGDQTITINEAAEFLTKLKIQKSNRFCVRELLQNMPTLPSNSTSENGGTTSFQKIASLSSIRRADLLPAYISRSEMPCGLMMAKTSGLLVIVQ